MNEVLMAVFLSVVYILPVNCLNYKVIALFLTDTPKNLIFVNLDSSRG